MPRLGPGEIFLIVLMVLLLFGAKRIPEIGQSMGKGIREFKRSFSGVDDMLNSDEPADRVGEGRSSTTTSAPRSTSGPKRLSQ